MAMANVTIEFDAMNPLVVLIEAHEKGGDIGVSSKHFFKGDKTKPHSVKMDERVDSDSQAIFGDWERRRVQGAPRKPHFTDPDHPHAPAVVHFGETVKFLCVRPFKIWVQREPNVIPDLSSPENPFGWATTLEAQKINGDFTVTATVVGGATAQRYYKCVAWVDIGDNRTVLIDPDVIVD